MLIATMSNKTALIVLMSVLIVFVVLLAVLAIVFIIALRKRAPVVKVVMAPARDDLPEPQPAAAADNSESAEASVKSQAAEEPVTSELPDTEEDDRDDVVYVNEGKERIRYDRSFEAKIVQLRDESKEWYTTLKNELLSYKKVKSRISWRHESFQMGRMKLAKFVVRGKTLCLMLAVEPAGYKGTKYAVEDVSGVASSADTPTLYRIKSERRVKYAVEMIQGIMKELGSGKQPNYEAQDYFLPYEGTMGLIQRGLIKRVISNTTRTFEIRELGDDELPATMEYPATADLPETEEKNSESEAAATTDKK